MKKLLLLLVCSLIIFKSKGQVVFCPPGATWYYTFLLPFGYNVQNAAIKYAGDTIAGSDTLKILYGAKFYKRQNCSYTSRILIKQKGDTIFMNCNKTQNNWQILYNYAALPGQTWKTTFLDAKNNIVTYTVTVDSVSSITVNNFNLKVLDVRYLANGWNGIYAENAKIIERYGCNQYMFNYNTVDGVSDPDQFLEYLCYRDNAFYVKQFTSKPCNYSDALGINERNNLPGLKIFPNPSSSVLTLEFEDHEMSSHSKLEIVNVLGEKVLAQEVTKVINIEGIETGIYFLRIFKNEKLIAMQKIIKE